MRTKLDEGLVLVRVAFFQPEQSVDLIHRVLHDALHLALCDMRILLVARTRGAFDSGMYVFDGAVSEGLSNDPLRFFCKMRVNTRTRRLAIPR